LLKAACGGPPTLYYVHTDHLNRPIRMSNGAKAMVWSAEYQPWGAVQSLSGPLTMDLRFPGQWFQLEAGLHYNWHRHYDPTLGRYTQPDPLGFVDGPSVFGYVRGSPYRYIDTDGRNPAVCAIPGVCPVIVQTVIEACTIAWIFLQNTLNDELSDEEYLEQCKDLCHQDNPDKFRQFCRHAGNKGWIKQRLYLCYKAADSNNPNECEGYCNAAFGE